MTCGSNAGDAYLRQEEEWQGVPALAEDELQAQVGVHQQGRRGTAAASACTDRRTGTVAGGRAEGALCLLRRADEHRRCSSRSAPHQDPLVQNASASKPAASNEVGANERDRGAQPADAEHPAPVARLSLPRQSPEIGAGCLNWARPDLCGGRPVTAVPTAIGASGALGPGRAGGPADRRGSLGR